MKNGKGLKRLSSTIIASFCSQIIAVARFFGSVKLKYNVLASYESLKALNISAVTRSSIYSAVHLLSR